MQINKTTERIVQKVVTQNGEITVNLNLNIMVEGQIKGIQVSSDDQKIEEVAKIETKLENKEFVPEEIFELDIPVLNNFGN